MKKKMFLLVPFLLASTLFFCFATFVFGAAVLPDDEVEALRGIAKSLGKTDWNFSVDPCSGDSGWFYRAEGSKENNLPCDCSSSNGTVCHVVSITVEFNQLSGNLPPELSHMPSIERFLLSSNYFTGELPDSFAGLITLNDFRISDNQFSRKIPNYIQNWKKLGKLVIQASGLKGPIPPGVALLEKLSDWRISDLNGSEEPFPPLNNLTQLKTLILRSCNITGQLPEFLGEMTTLKTLDLSFNKLRGEIPSSFASLQKSDYMCLCGC